MTWAPYWASAREISDPMAPFAPVTSAVFPASMPIIVTLNIDEIGPQRSTEPRPQEAEIERNRSRSDLYFNSRDRANLDRANQQYDSVAARRQRGERESRVGQRNQGHVSHYR